jgi:hypothetical protein
LTLFKGQVVTYKSDETARVISEIF